jgi:hypothetical protein
MHACMNERTPLASVRISFHSTIRSTQQAWAVTDDPCITYLDEGAVDEPLEVVKAHHVIVHVPPHLPKQVEHTSLYSTVQPVVHTYYCT